MSFNSFSTFQDIDKHFDQIDNKNSPIYLQLSDPMGKVCLHNLKFPEIMDDKYGLAIAEYIRVCVFTAFAEFVHIDPDKKEMDIHYDHMKVCKRYFLNLINGLNTTICDTVNADKQKIYDYYHYLLGKQLHAYTTLEQTLKIQN